MGRGRFGCAAGGVVVLWVVLAVACCGSAAGVQPGVPASFGSFGEGAGQFEEPHGIAVGAEAGVDGVNGNVYVVDRNGSRVDEFSGDGEFVRAWGWGVLDGNAASESCTTASGCRKGMAGSGAGQLSENAEGVAVDNTGLLGDPSHGDVYVTDAANDRVEKFSGEGSYLGAFGGEGAGNGQFEGPRPIAVDAEGHVYVGDNTRVQKFSEAGVYEATVVSGVGAIESVVVAPNEDIYVLSSGQAGVREYEPGGTEVPPARDEAGRPLGTLVVDAAGSLFVDDVENFTVHHLFEYDSAGEQTESFDRAPQSEDAQNGMALGETAEALYLINSTGETDRIRTVTPPAPGPLVVQGEAVALPRKAARVEAEINSENAETEYFVEYGTTDALGSSTAAQTLPASFTGASVSIELNNLEFSTEYHYCVVAVNANGRTPCVQNTFESSPATSIDAVWVAGVTAASVTFDAEVNPEETATSCGFEYGTAASYAASGTFEHVVAGSAIATPGDSDMRVSAHVGEGEGIAPGGEYAYRLVCEKEGVVDRRTVQVFRSQAEHAGGALLDQRTIEDVASGAGGSRILHAEGLPHIALAGDAIAYARTAPAAPGAQGNFEPVEMARHQASGGWTAADISTPYNRAQENRAGGGTEYRLFSGDLSAAIVAPWDANPLAAGVTERTPYRRTETGGQAIFEPLLTGADVSTGAKYGEANTVVGASPDLKHVLLEAGAVLTQGGVSGALYEWSQGGALGGVSVPPGGGGETIAGTLGAGYQGAANTRGAVSADGSLVYWTPAEGGGGLFVRDTASGESLRLDVPQGVTPAGSEEEAPLFQLASVDGSRAFFTDTQRLIAGASATVGAPDLYMCQITTPPAGPLSCSLSDVTSGVLGAGEHAGVQGLVAGASEAGTRVYFIAKGVLAAGANAGENNLYTAVESEGGWHVSFIATLSPQDAADWATNRNSGRGLPELADHASSGGGWFAFVSRASLTGYDNRDVVSGQPDNEVFLYDAQNGRLSCVSCDATGARPAGPGRLASWESVTINGKLTSYLPMSLSDAGRLFFESASSLAAGVSGGVFGVYEFEPAGVGSCAAGEPGFAGVAGGCVGLVSPAGGRGDAEFLGASASGDDAFVLAPAGEGAGGGPPPSSIFDAHSCEAGSSWSCAPAAPAAPTGCESGVGCRETQAAGGFPPAGGAASESLEGAGNLSAGHGGSHGAKRGAGAHSLKAALARCRRLHRHAARHRCIRRAHRRFRSTAAGRLRAAGTLGIWGGMTALLTGLVLRQDAGRRKDRTRRSKRRLTVSVGCTPSGSSAARFGRSWLLAAIIGLAGMTMLFLYAARPAFAAQAWWHISPTSRPTILQRSTAENQEVTAGELTVLSVAGNPVACVGSASAACGPFGASSAAQLQALLETNGQYANVVTVSEPSSGVFAVETPWHVPPLEILSTSGGSLSVRGGSGGGRLVVLLSNLGDASAEGEPSTITISDALPSWIVPTSVEAPAGAQGSEGGAACAVKPGKLVTCSFSGTLPPFESIEMEVEAAVTGSPSPGQEAGQVTVSGGGAQPVSVPQLLATAETATPFGVEKYDFTAEEEGGGLDTQAGSHPFQLTSVVDLNQGPVSGINHREAVEAQPALPRNFRFQLPAGLVGDASSVPQCSEQDFNTDNAAFTNDCPASAAIGVATTTIIEHAAFGLTTIPVAVFNLAPAAGEPARFGFTVADVPVVLDTSVRPGEAYGVTVSVNDTKQVAQLLDSVVSLWGVPGDPRHDISRGTDCVDRRGTVACTRPEGLQEKPFLRLPTSCGALLGAPMELEPWNVPLGSQIVTQEASLGKLDGCNKVPFEPKLAVASSTSRAATPTGLTVHLKVPQQTSADPERVAEADVRNTTVTLPQGLQLNPGAASGLQGCSEQDVGYLHRSPAGEPVFSEESLEEERGETPHTTGCPEASQLGTVKIDTPLLKEPLTGAVYQADQNANPFGSLLALYLVAQAPHEGVRVRLAGEVHVQPDGQLVSNFPQTPQTPFGEFTLKFFEGPKAALATTGCGTYTTTSLIEPWSSTPASPFTASPSSFFEVTSGPGGSSCSSVGGFAPSFTAGMTNNHGGSFSPLRLTIARNDGEQPLSTVSVKMPPGLAGMISSVQPCPEAQANAGDCPAASKIGHVRVSAGVGSEPVVLPEAGKPEDPVYLTAPYKGAPFGVAIVVPAQAGPFDLGTVVVRGTIAVDPHTAQVTIQTEPAPTRLQGIPLDVRNVEVVVDKPGFMFNPTSCQPLSITGAIGSSEGASENVNSRFQAADCAALPFKPSFKVFSHARHTRRNGAYLRVKVTSGKGQANIKSVHVELPKVLPSRAETLKLACEEKQFAQNPAGCPAGSHVGTATAHTPVLPTPLTGPAIFVSHGGAAFPDLDIVLQGDGVTVELEGATNITKGITSSNFKSVPDVPVSSFELTLPPSSHSALAGEGNLCFKTTHKHGRTVRHRVKLTMPTTITGQNGAVIKQNTAIKVEGCGKTTRHHSHTKRHKKKK